MEADASACVLTPRGGHVDGARTGGHDAPMGGGGSVAQHRVGATGEHGCHPGGLRRSDFVAHGIHALMHRQQSLGANATIDRGPAEP